MLMIWCLYYLLHMFSDGLPSEESDSDDSISEEESDDNVDDLVFVLYVTLVFRGVQMGRLRRNLILRAAFQ